MLPNRIEKIENGAFAGNLIEKLEIPGSVRSIDEGAFIRNKIKDLTINEGLKSIGRLSFANNQLTELTIPSSMRDLGRRAFYNNKISKLTILPGIEKLGAQCFENNIIQEVYIPETVKHIDLGAFVYNSLEDVKLPEGLKVVGPKSFGVNNLESVTFPETVEWFCPNAFRKNSGYESGEFKIFIDKTIEIDGDIKESVLKDKLNKEIKVRAAVFEGLIDEPKHKIDIKSWERVGEENEYLIYRGKFEEIPEELLNCGLGSSCENIVENMQMTSLIVKVKLKGELLEPKNPENPIDPGEPEKPEEPVKEPWDAKYFTFEGTTLTGFSELGQEKFKEDKELVIPEKTIDGQVVDSIGDKAFNLDSFGEDGIKSLTLPETIKTIGLMAFRNNNIVHLELPDSVEELGNGAFAANKDLETLKLSNNLKKIPQGAFSFSKIEKLVIPEGVTEIGGSAFVGGDLLIDVTIPSTVEKIDYKAFQNIKAPSIIIPGSVKEIGSDAFAGGYLSNLVLEEGIETIRGRAFKRNKLTKVTIPKSVTELDKSAFDLNQNINIKYTSLIKTLEKADKVDTEGKPEEKVKALEKAIEAGKTINAKPEATLDEVNTIVKQIQETIDDLENRLTTMEVEYIAKGEITEIVPEIVTFREDKFTVPVGVIEFIFKDGNKEIKASFTEEKWIMEEIINEAQQAVEEAIKKVKDLELNQVTIGNIRAEIEKVVDEDIIVEVIAVEAEEGKYQVSLKKGEAITEKTIIVTKVEEKSDFEFSNGKITAYNGFATDVIIPEEINGEKVISIGSSVFKGKNLTSVKIPNTVESIGMAAFANNKLTSIELPEKLTEMGNMVFFNNELTYIKIPNGLTEISTAAFSNNKLTSIEIPENITRLAMKAFMNNNLETVVISSRMENIGGSAFAGNNLQQVIIPSSVQDIGKKAFDGNDNIKLTYSVLVEAIEKADKVDTEGKPEEKIKALEKAIEAGKTINAKPEATLEEVNTVVKDINNAIESLLELDKKIVDFSKAS